MVELFATTECTPRLEQSSARGAINIENQIGDNLGNNVIDLYGNLVVGEAGVYGYGLFGEPTGITNAYVIRVRHNTFIGFTTTGIRLSANPLTVTVENNIVYTTSGTQAFSFGSAVTTTRRNNIWFGTTLKDQGGGAADNSTGDLNVDPLLIDPSIDVGTFSCCGGVLMPGVITEPPTRGDHRTQVSSPARNAGSTTVGAFCGDARGRPCYAGRAPDIGAYQATSGDPAATRTAR